MPGMRSSLTYLLLCCLAMLPTPPALAARMALDDGWRQCAANPASITTAAALWQWIKPGKLQCLERDFDLASMPPTPQVLVLSALAASELWLDGRLVGSNGQPAASGAGEIAGRIDMVIALAPAQLAAGPHRLRLSWSTQQVPARLDAPFYAMFLQDQQAYLAAQTWRQLPPLLLAGALGATAVLLHALHLLYRRRPHTQVFMALCLVAALLLVAETWRSLAGYAYPLHIDRLYAVTLLSWLFSALLPLYFYTAYGLPRWPWAAVLLFPAVLLAGAFSAHFDSQCRLMFLAGLLLGLALNLHALWCRLPGRRSGSAIMLVSCILFVLAGRYFAEGGFALVVCLLLVPLAMRLLLQMLRERKKAARAQQLENQLLRKSLQPHFLMNSLSLLSELNAQSPQAAEDFIVALGAEFRMLNDYAQQPVIALTQELALCHNYLQIMSARLQQPCILQLDGDPAAITVPPALLLTALENAYSHNRYRHGALFCLHIRQQGRTRRLRLTLPAGEPRAHAGSGLGEQYIRASLQDVFGHGAGYDVGRCNQAGA